MPYASLSGLVARFGADMLVDLTDRAHPAVGEIDEAVANAALVDTDALIDGWLARRYSLPLGTVPALLATTAETIAIYKLHAHVVPDKIRDDYRDALKLLERISAGDVRLPGLDGAEPAASSGSGVRATDRDRPMTAENLRGYV